MFPICVARPAASPRRRRFTYQVVDPRFESPAAAADAQNGETP